MEMRVKLTEEEAYWLLHDLCVKVGFCLPPNVTQRIIKNPPTAIDWFSSVVYRAEGLDPALRSPLYEQVREQVAAAFQNHLDQRTDYSV